MENKKNMNMILAVIICILVAGALIFISINNKVNNAALTANSTNNLMINNTPSAAPANNNSASEIAKTGDTVSMNYTGRLQDGTVFDSNVDPKFKHVEPFTFKLGAGQVIAGWDKGIVGMKVGEKKTLTIPPADAYGANGIPGTIPPNSTLVFDVELLAIKK